MVHSIRYMELVDAVNAYVAGRIALAELWEIRACYWLTESE
jgi:hypothetical protein